jgi:hypothetical protein
MQRDKFKSSSQKRISIWMIIWKLVHYVSSDWIWLPHFYPQDYVITEWHRQALKSCAPSCRHCHMNLVRTPCCRLPFAENFGRDSRLSRKRHTPWRFEWHFGKVTNTQISAIISAYSFGWQRDDKDGLAETAMLVGISHRRGILADSWWPLWEAQVNPYKSRDSGIQNDPSQVRYSIPCPAMANNKAVCENSSLHKERAVEGKLTLSIHDRNALKK